jgi:hypothetical protein
MKVTRNFSPKELNRVLDLEMTVRMERVKKLSRNKA